MRLQPRVLNRDQERFLIRLVEVGVPVARWRYKSQSRGPFHANRVTYLAIGIQLGAHQ
ncbi:hypothetical protein D9M71_810640 [compost metagenome]